MQYLHKILIDRGLFMEFIELYYKYIIKPLEERVKELKCKLHNKKFYWNRNNDKKQLDLMESLLITYYKKLDSIVEEEIKFDENIVTLQRENE